MGMIVAVIEERNVVQWTIVSFMVAGMVMEMVMTMAMAIAMEAKMPISGLNEVQMEITISEDLHVLRLWKVCFNPNRGYFSAHNVKNEPKVNRITFEITFQQLQPS